MTTKTPKSENRALTSHRRSLTVVSKMRWVTLVLGPVPLIWDRVLMPQLESMGMPAMFSIEDMIGVLLVDILPLDQYSEQFDFIWPHLMRVSTILFIVFVVWTMVARRKVVEHKELALEARIETEVERRLEIRLAQISGQQIQADGPPSQNPLPGPPDFAPPKAH